MQEALTATQNWKLRSNAISLGTGVKPGTAVDTITVHQSDRWHLQFDSSLDQPFWLG